MTKSRSNSTGKLVWRISKSAPKGEWVDPGVSKEPTSALAQEVASGSSWASSSFDLLAGAQVSEEDATTIPADLYDELFGSDTSQPKLPTKPRKTTPKP